MSLIFYNPHAFKKLNPKYNNSAMFDVRRNTCKISRIDEWNDKFFTVNVKNLFPMIDYKSLSYGLSFEECCRKRAVEIASQGKKIHLYWSGGMDSCVALLSLLTFNDVENMDLHVFMTSRSVKDFPEYYEKFVKDLPHTIEDEYDDLLMNGYDKNVLNVSGDGAEEVVGWSGELSYNCRDEWKGRTYHHTRIEDLNPDDDTDLKWIKQYKEVESTLEYSPIPIETIYDLNWWIRICFDYQYASMRYAVPYVKDLTNYEIYNIPFFLTDYFVEWSIREYVPHRNFDDYNHFDKMPSKQFLSQFFDSSLRERILNMKRFTNVEYYNYVAIDYFGYDHNYKQLPLLKGLELTDTELNRFKSYDKEEMLIFYD